MVYQPVRLAILSLVILVQGSKTVVRVLDEDASNGNPIRKVVAMMEKMASKIKEEGEKEAELYDKFECYCKKTSAELEGSITNAQAAPVSQADIDSKEAQIKVLEGEVAKLKTDELAEESTLKSADAQRGKEHGTYEEEIVEEKEVVKSVDSAIGALDGKGAAFLQGKGAEGRRLRTALEHSRDFMDKQRLTSFLDGTEPDTGFVKGTLASMEDDTKAEMARETAEEEKSKATFAQVEESKHTEISAVLEQLERKMKLIGELKVEVVNMKHDMEDTGSSLADSQHMLADLQKTCSAKAKAWEERKAVRAEEDTALQDTINMLSSDESLDMFRNRGASLIQLDGKKEQDRSKALDFIKAAVLKDLREHPELNFLALALSGKQVDFGQVRAKIDSMVELLKKESADDQTKVDYCKRQFHELASKSQSLSSKIEGLSASLSQKEDLVKKLEGEVKAIQDGVKELDESIAAAGENRKAEHAEYQETMAADNSALELLSLARNRLNKVYHPDMVPVTTTPSPYDPYALLQESQVVEISRHSLLTEAPPTFSGEYKKSSSSNGVLSMITQIVTDIEKELAVAKSEEANSQKEYEESLEDASKKREADLALAAQKAKNRADVKSDFVADKSEKKAKADELKAANSLEANIHTECDWLLKNFDLRAQARSDEKENLISAKAVLSGA